MARFMLGSIAVAIHMLMSSEEGFSFEKATENMTFSNVQASLSLERAALVWELAWKHNVMHLFIMAILFKVLSKLFERLVERYRVERERMADAGAASAKTTTAGKRALLPGGPVNSPSDVASRKTKRGR